MNKGTFSFALLQYHHSQILGEILNIGLVVYFPEHKTIKFIRPERLIRLKFAYPDIPEKTLKNYFKYFDNRISEINSQSDLFSVQDKEFSLEAFINQELLPSDSSSLQFGPIKKSLLYSNEISLICNQLYNLYFSVFSQSENTPDKIDESVLINKYIRWFDELQKSKNHTNHLPKIRYDYQLTATSGVEVKFDFTWQAEKKLHLVKPISFDLVKPDGITDKAYRYYGKFIDLESLAEKNEYNFDVLLSKPSDKNLFRAYDIATKLISTPKAVNIIEFDGLKQYAKMTFEQLQFQI